MTPTIDTIIAEMHEDARACSEMGAHIAADKLGRYASRLAALPAPGEWQAEIARLNAIINTPHADDFWKAASIEAEHQVQRWANSHDAGKTPPDWFWLIGYLAGKALHAFMYGNDAKAEHHVITTAAACKNWHRAMKGETDMRPGIDGEAALAAAPLAAAQGEADNG